MFLIVRVTGATTARRGQILNLEITHHARERAVRSWSWSVFVSDNSPTLAFGSAAPLKDESECERERGRERVLLS